MERKKIGGSLAISGKKWKCYVDSKFEEIKGLNKNLSDRESKSVFEIVQSVNKQCEESENDNDIEFAN